MSKRTKNPIEQLAGVGQSVWLDTISRDMIAKGELRRLVALGVRGVTSNPDIFHKAITGSSIYDSQIDQLAKRGLTALEIYERLAVEDVRRAADLLLPLYKKTKRADGYVSLEVSPYLAHDAAGTVAEAKRLWQAVGRPNLMIKVPATKAGLQAIAELIAEGINVNVTLLFSIPNYRDVMEAYLEGLEARRASKQPLDTVHSVASFFVSRIDTLVDRLLASRLTNLPEFSPVKAEKWLGTAAVAAAKLAYQEFKSVFGSARFRKLSHAGANLQRPLWASTSTKNPLYPDTKYVGPLVGRHTVNTMPLVTLHAWLDHGIVVEDAVEADVEWAKSVAVGLEQVGISLDAVGAQLQEEGIAKFLQPFDKLLAAIEAKRQKALGVTRIQVETLPNARTVQESSQAATEALYIPRLWGKDTSLWTQDEKVARAIANRLGWLDVAAKMRPMVKDLTHFAAQVRRDGFRHVVLLGMGGSSLCPEVCAKTFGAAKDYPDLRILDNTDPAAVQAVRAAVSLPHTLFIAASKSGTTIETNVFYKYFRAELEKLGVSNAGNHFVAITDEGTPLVELARREKFRRVFINPSDIGGRFSALSLFGLVPMALIGMDLGLLLDRVLAFSRGAGNLVSAQLDSGVRLGIILGEAAKAKRDKMTLVLSPKLASLGDWIEQLVAESTGKCGKGILPVIGERLASVSMYQADRCFVSIALRGDKEEARVSALEKQGHPVVRIQLNDLYDLGIEFLRWEIATAICGSLLGINPFDEPNVTESKRNTSELLESYCKSGRLAYPQPHYKTNRLTLSFTGAARKIVGERISRPKDALRALALSAEEGDYLALLAFLHPTKRVESRLQALRFALRDSTHAATTLGYGPRYLHSTGQLHKGGPNTGIYFVFIANAFKDVEIPGEAYSFSVLSRAQALGDFRALEAHGRRAVLVNLGEDIEGGLAEFSKLLGVND